MGQAKRSLSVPSEADVANARSLLAGALPLTVEALTGYQLTSHCDRCGRLHRVYPGPHDLHPRMRLVDLIGTLLCRARRDGRACGGRPRRLVLAREGHAVEGHWHHLTPTWTLDHAGEWVEDEGLFWEDSDFASR
jgi:hypothetical protein